MQIEDLCEFLMDDIVRNGANLNGTTREAPSFKYKKNHQNRFTRSISEIWGNEHKKYSKINNLLVKEVV